MLMLMLIVSHPHVSCLMSHVFHARSVVCLVMIKKLVVVSRQLLVFCVHRHVVWIVSRGAPRARARMYMCACMFASHNTYMYMCASMCAWCDGSVSDLNNNVLMTLLCTYTYLYLCVVSMTYYYLLVYVMLVLIFWSSHQGQKRYAYDFDEIQWHPTSIWTWQQHMTWHDENMIWTSHVPKHSIASHVITLTMYEARGSPALWSVINPCVPVSQHAKWNEHVTKYNTNIIIREMLPRSN
jgi:hypothetical protein